MTLREIAEILLAAKRQAARVGASFHLDADRLASMGISFEQKCKIQHAIDQIEEFIEQKLSEI